MSLTQSTVYLITGANRGIGLSLVKKILTTHPTAFVYAGVRNVADSSALTALQETYPGRIDILECVSGDAEVNAALAKEIEVRHGRVDTVVANAAISKTVGTVLRTSARVFEDHFIVNVLGPVILFQMLHTLLKASQTPRFVSISTSAASLDGVFMPPAIGGLVGYGASKAALNYVTRKIHFENEWLTAFPLAPGVVDTDAIRAAISVNANSEWTKILKNQLITPDNCATGLLEIIDKSTRDQEGGEFLNVDGTKLPW